ncbi:MAG: 2,3-bisphosphoglycerate-independent phosphoglycerate mutase [Caldilineaceae bacterium]
MQTEEQAKPVRTNAEDATVGDRAGVPYSTGYGVPEPEYVGQQPNRFPDDNKAETQFVTQNHAWAPEPVTEAPENDGAPTSTPAHGTGLPFLQKLIKRNASKMVLLVMDGLGGHPQAEGGQTELETAKTPNLDSLAARGICGLQQPVATGITSGSGPGHLALFGYEPLTYQIGRGALSALGVNFDLQPQDVAARGNFCSVDEQGRITDRRAGRIASAKGKELCALLNEVTLPGVEVFVQPVEEYRFLLVLRGEGLAAAVTDTDPQTTGVEPLAPQPRTAAAKETAELVQQFLAEAQKRLADHHPANMVLLRGFAQRPNWPTLAEAYGLHAAAIAAYPMYRGVARLLGMEPLETEEEPAAKFAVLTKRWRDFDFFFVHIKRTDSAGEDGDFARKVALIEAVDTQIPRLLALDPDVVMVTGDHSTPAVLRAHSWHPVPVLLWSPYCRPDEVKHFGERPCIAGALGPRFPAAELMPLALANALRLEKFGA